MTRQILDFLRVTAFSQTFLAVSEFFQRIQVSKFCGKSSNLARILHPIFNGVHNRYRRYRRYSTQYDIMSKRSM